MNVYKIGGMLLKITSPNESYIKMCRDYEYSADSTEATVFDIVITEEDIEKEKALYAFPCSSDMANFTCIYRHICNLAIQSGGFFLHSAVIEYDDKAYAFLAPSGTGKSTHIKLWRKLLGGDVGIVNGDKPLLMPLKDGSFYAHGTPWAGKEGWQRNIAVKLGAICILKRGKDNAIKEISPLEALGYILKQTLIPDKEDAASKLLENIDAFLSTDVKCYVLECNMSLDAAVTSFEAMTGDSAKKYLEKQQST